MDPAFSDGDARAAWNHGARGFDRFVESGADYYRRDVHGPALLEACAPIDQKTVIDLGCGQGFFTRELAKAGGRVTGVDLSDELVAYARRYEEVAPLGVAYRVMSAALIDHHWPANSIDVITSCMALQDMADVASTLASAKAILTREGRMVFSVPHPCTDTPVREWERTANHEKRALKIDRYFETGPAVCHWTMPRLVYQWDTPIWRRTLAEWSALIAQAGFAIGRLLEPRPTAAQVEQNRKLADCYRLPYFLIFDLVKREV